MDGPVHKDQYPVGELLYRLSILESEDEIIADVLPVQTESISNKYN